MKVACLFVLVSLLIGCASSGAIKLSEKTYMISKTSAAGVFVNMGKLKAIVIKEANEFAESKGKVAVAVSLIEKEAIPGRRLPSVDYQFRLEEKGTKPARGGVLKPFADKTVEINNNSNSTSNRYDELIKLGELRKSGVISEEEFLKEKNRILAD